MGGMPSSQVIAAVALVDDLDRPTRVLAARRTGPPALAGGWEFPGGKVEAGEEPAAAAIREVAEELGVRVHLGGQVGQDWPLVPPRVMRLWWAVLADGEGEPAPAENDPSHDALRWLTREQLFDVAWLEPDRPVVEHLAGMLHTP